jgi:hypothetical protein
MAFLKLPEIWLCFSFFVFSTAALAAVQSFAGPALARLYGLPPAVTGLVVTVYMIVASVAMLAGGFLASRVRHVERTVEPDVRDVGGAAGAGRQRLAAGPRGPRLRGAGGRRHRPGRALARPDDRSAPPRPGPRAASTAPCTAGWTWASRSAPGFGWFMDHGWPGAVFHGAAAVLLMAVLSAVLIGPQVAALARLARRLTLRVAG